MGKQKKSEHFTMRDVAAAAEVSVATVSRVFNKPEAVRPELVERVEAAVQKLNFRPSRSAKGLRHGIAVQRVGFLVSNIQNSFFTDVLKGVEQHLIAKQVAIVLGNSNNDMAYEALNIELMLEEQVAGIIAQFNSTQRKHYVQLLQNKIPIVCIDHAPEGIAVDSVVTNGRVAMRQATTHLFNLGHRAFGLVGGSLDYTTMRERQAGFLDALNSADIDQGSIWIENGDMKLGGSYTAVNRLLDRSHLPLALLTVNNEATIATLRVLQERKLRIPDDVALVGFDELSWAVAYNPPLTVIDQHPYYIGTSAAELLQLRIHDPERPIQQVELEATLVVRESCGTKQKL